MREKWKDIPGFKDRYQVGNRGNIKSLSRLKFCGKRVTKGTQYKEKILKNNIDTHGYVRVNLWKNNVAVMVKVHSLVCRAFIPNPENKKDTNHKNGIKTDNRAVNLEWNTRSENLLHAYKNGLKKPYWDNKFGADHCRSKKVIQMNMDSKKIKIFNSIRDAAKATGVNFAGISEVCNKRRQKTAGGFKWKFK